MKLFLKFLLEQAIEKSNSTNLKYLCFIALACTTIPGFAQSEIPLGTWRIHISFNNIHSIAFGDQKVYGASSNGIMVLDRLDNSIDTYSKISGLQGSGITSIGYHLPTNQLLIGNADGKIDIVRNKEIISLDPTRNSALTGPKKINHISIHNNLAYLSADFGVVIFDFMRNEVKETWRDIGVNGSTLQIFESTILGDSIFLATEQGVLAGNLNNNLLDFNYWKKFNTGDFFGSIKSVAAFNGKVYAAVSSKGLFRYEFGKWTKENILDTAPIKSLNASPTSLFISGDTKLWRLSDNNIFSEITNDLIHQPNMVIEEANGQLWIADDKSGIVSNPLGSFTSFLPSGPSNSKTFKLYYGDKHLYSLGGGYTSMYAPLGLSGSIDKFTLGSWSQQSSSLLDLTDITFNVKTGLTHVSSFGHGVEERNESESLAIFNEQNSPLVNTNFPLQSINITSIERWKDGLWVANYGASKSLHFLTDENNWESYSFPITASRYPVELAVDFFNSVWQVLDPIHGGGVMVFNREDNINRYLTNIDGSGGLPSRAVRSIAIDRDGIVWLGTDEGVCYFFSSSEIFSSEVNAIKPIYENRFLLRDDKITAIAVDGGNRKWMGTERGVWLFNPTGEKMIYNFTSDNSPLLSNFILDIEINHATGEVFFATDQGLISFRADATESTLPFQGIKIFPNPVQPNFQGLVGISGLATDAIVKVTDIAGRLMWETRASGGTASWNIKDYHGKRASTGIYLVFSTSTDGAETVVGKIAVIE